MDALTIVVSILGTIGTVILGVVGKFIMDRISKHIDSVDHNTTQLAILSAQIKDIVEDTRSIPKIKEDLNHLHKWRKKHEDEHD